MENRFSIHTLGCKVNQYESEKFRETLVNMGFIEVSEPANSDLAILNSCTVTSLADRKSRQFLHGILKNFQGRAVIVTGCAVDNKLSGLTSEDGKILFLNNSQKELFKKKVQELFPDCQEQCSKLEQKRNRAYIKVGDGCDRFCSYCIVPYVRGPIRSIPIDEILEEIRGKVASDIKEIVLTAVHLGAYGEDLPDKRPDLADLLEQIVASTDGVRIRLSSIEPVDITDRLLEIIAKNRSICHHLHLPLQHAATSVLKRMNRSYTQSEFKAIVDSIRQKITDCAITTDVIVGFPGESEQEFQELKKFVQEIQFLKLHVFKYSMRTGTKAATMPDQISGEIKKRRSEELLHLSTEMANRICRSKIGTETELLIEGSNGEYQQGLTGDYIRVYLKSPKDLYNQFVRVRIEKVDNGMVFGSIIE